MACLVALSPGELVANRAPEVNADDVGVGMKRIFIASDSRKGRPANASPSFASNPLSAESTNDGPGSSRGPSLRSLLSKVQGFVQYQQSGSDERRSRPAGLHNAGTQAGSWSITRESVDPQAELGRRACGELVANPTPAHN